MRRRLSVCIALAIGVTGIALAVDLDPKASPATMLDRLELWMPQRMESLVEKKIALYEAAMTGKSSKSNEWKHISVGQGWLSFDGKNNPELVDPARMFDIFQRRLIGGDPDQIHDLERLLSAQGLSNEEIEAFFYALSIMTPLTEFHNRHIKEVMKQTKGRPNAGILVGEHVISQRWLQELHGKLSARVSLILADFLKNEAFAGYSESVRIQTSSGSFQAANPSGSAPAAHIKEIVWDDSENNCFKNQRRVQVSVDVIAETVLLEPTTGHIQATAAGFMYLTKNNSKWDGSGSKHTSAGLQISHDNLKSTASLVLYKIYQLDVDETGTFRAYAETKASAIYSGVNVSLTFGPPELQVTLTYTNQYPLKESSFNWGVFLCKFPCQANYGLKAEPNPNNECEYCPHGVDTDDTCNPDPNDLGEDPADDDDVWPGDDDCNCAPGQECVLGNCQSGDSGGEDDPDPTVILGDPVCKICTEYFFGICIKEEYVRCKNRTEGHGYDLFVYDLNQDGHINNNIELLRNWPSNHSNLPNTPAINLMSFDLPKYGGNGDGILDEEDVFTDLLYIWNDSNRDGASSFEEWTPFNVVFPNGLDLWQFMETIGQALISGNVMTSTDNPGSPIDK